MHVDSFFDAIVSQCPDFSAQNMLKNLILPLALCCTSAMAQVDDFFSTPSKAQFEVPEIGSGIGLLDQQKERLIGEKVLRQVQQQMPVLQDPWLEDQFMTVFSHILSQTELGQPIALVVVNDAQINAFAVPGGLFALNTGLILSARNMDEVAGVMAHEIAHVTQRHYSRSQEAFKGQGLLALAGILVGAALATQADGGDVGGAIMMGTQAALLDKQLSYSRNQEREADRIGMQYMYTAGYNPQSMADFFEIMNRATSRVSYLPDFWFTHPLTTQRMSEARLRANQLAQNKAVLKQDADFEILKWYSAVVSKQATDAQLKTLVTQKKMAGFLALAKYNLMRSNEDEAQKLLNIAQAQGSHHLITLLQTDLYLSENQLDSAYKSIISAQRIAPENRALSYKLAEVLLRQGKGQDVQTLVQKFLQKNPRDVAGWRLMQQGANVDHAVAVRAINVLRYRAEAEYWSGEEKNAIKSLLHAQRLAKDNASLLATIDARLTVMQDEYKQKI